MSLAEAADHQRLPLTPSELRARIVDMVGTNPHQQFLVSELVRSVGEDHVLDVMLGVMSLLRTGRLERVSPGQYRLPRDPGDTTRRRNLRSIGFDEHP